MAEYNLNVKDFLYQTLPKIFVIPDKGKHVKNIPLANKF